MTNERYPIIRVPFPNWDKVREPMQKIYKLSNNIRPIEELPVGEYDSDFFVGDGNDIAEGLPPWFWYWYNYAEKVLTPALRVIREVYHFPESCYTQQPEDWHIWAQLYKCNSLHSVHTHGHGVLSACQYITFNPEVHTATQFFHTPPDPFSGNVSPVIPKVNEGDFLFFPGQFAHSSGVNTSTEPRGIVAFNIGVYDYFEGAKYEPRSFEGW